jgi:oligopeptidase B
MPVELPVDRRTTGSDQRVPEQRGPAEPPVVVSVAAPPAAPSTDVDAPERPAPEPPVSEPTRSVELPKVVETVAGPAGDLEPAEPGEPPSAPAIPAHREMHGVVWTDEYAWMRDHGRAEFTTYLRAERAFYDTATSHLAHLSRTLFTEVEQRLQRADESISWQHGDAHLYTRTVPGSEYHQLLSRRGGTDPRSTDQSRILLDEAELAKGFDDYKTVAVGESGSYAAIGVREVSPDGHLLAYNVDLTGDESYTLRFRNLRSDRDLTVDDDLPDTIEGTHLGGAWSADSTTFFYLVRDRAGRAHQVWRHRVGTPTSTDVIVYQEPDPRFSVSVKATRSGGFLVIESAARDTTEVWTIPGGDPMATPTLVAARRRGIEYRLDHYAEEGGSGQFLLVTNDGAEEFRLMQAPAAAASRPHWRQAFAARPGERLRACHALADHLLLELRRDGLPFLRVVDVLSGEEREIHADLPAARLRLTVPFSYHDTSVIITVDSLTEPPKWYDVDLATGERRLLKERVVPGYDPTRYRTERRHVTVEGGARVPVTLAWRADTPLDGTAPCLLSGYGAYEHCDDPAFDEALPSLLDRGLVYARSHPRGGGENGRAWWTNGRLAYKVNTFTDHIAVADWLAASRTVDGSRIATRGHSAGGLLVGATFALRPDRWRLVVAEAPFVDIVSTLLDPTLPLTTTEWAEWGDPRHREAFLGLRSYSPYENIPRGPRPAVLVTGAVNDSRVLIHEPAKWVARLRGRAVPGDGRLLFRVEFGPAAHAGPAGRYERYRYESEVLAIVLEHLTTR